MLQFFRQMWQRLWGRLRYCGAVHYLAGGPSLPPPLTPEQEKNLLDRMAAGDAAAREELIDPQPAAGGVSGKKVRKQRRARRGLGKHWHHRADQGGKHLHPCPQHQACHLRQPLHRQRDPDVPAQKLQPPAGSQHRRAFERGRRRQRAAAFGHPWQRCQRGKPAVGAGRRARRAAPRRGSAFGTGAADRWSFASALPTAWSAPRRKPPTPLASARAISPGWKSASSTP